MGAECSSDVSSDLGNDAFETSSAPEEAKKAKPNRRGWQPAADDAEPTLTVRLPGPTRVSAVSVRSAFQSLSVQVQETDGGDFVDVKVHSNRLVKCHRRSVCYPKRMGVAMWI